MAKELPYFRFTAQEWQNGDISLESYELKGLFIDLCAYYWISDCSTTLAKLEKKFKHDIKLIHKLINSEIIHHNEETEYIQINFLNEQYDVLSEQRKRRQNAGSRGGKQKSSNAKAKLKQKSSYKDKDKYNNKDNKKKEKTRKDYTDEIINFTGQLSNLFPENIRTRLDEKTKVSWFDTIDKLIRLDKYSKDEILKATKLGRQDVEFWTKQFLSLNKLRQRNSKDIKFIDVFLALNTDDISKPTYKVTTNEPIR
uniref:Uncharacterized protein n=1 Tax=uncultured marine virus TaxID=186617 RepID=A0A0F7L7E6_9VIRU|nr:hypothetical protein [uncultured marine virus]